MHNIAKYFSELVSKIVLVGAAAPCFTKGEKIFLMDLKKSTCDNLITQSKQDRPKMVSDLSNMFSKKRTLKARRC